MRRNEDCNLTPSLPRRGGGAVPHTPGRERLEAVVREAVFRYQLQQPLVDRPQVPRYYLAIQSHTGLSKRSNVLNVRNPKRLSRALHKPSPN
jgi:hypothetical protein